MKNRPIDIENFLNNLPDNINLDDFDLQSLALPEDLFLPEIPAFSENLFNDKSNIDDAKLLIQMDMLTFQNYILKINQEYEEALIAMKSFEFKNINKISGDEKALYVINVIQIFQRTCYYLNDETKQFFKKIKFDHELMNWFISLESILLEFKNIIERRQIIFLQGTALLSLDVYLKMRIKQEVDIWVGNTNPRFTDINKANNTFIAAKKKIKKSGQFYFEDDKLNQDVKLISAIFGHDQHTKNLLSFCRGDTSQFNFGMLIFLCENMTKIENATKFYAEFFDLFRPFIGKKSDNDVLGYVMLDKKQFSREFPNSNYSTYKGKRVKDIFTRR